METFPPPVIDSASVLRAELARRMMPVYQLSARVKLHPAHLGQVLRGRRPLSPELATRIRAALADGAHDTSSDVTA